MPEQMTRTPRASSELMMAAEAVSAWMAPSPRARFLRTPSLVTSGLNLAAKLAHHGGLHVFFCASQALPGHTDDTCIKGSCGKAVVDPFSKSQARKRRKLFRLGKS
jgi:hypothetical protein